MSTTSLDQYLERPGSTDALMPKETLEALAQMHAVADELQRMCDKERQSATAFYGEVAGLVQYLAWVLETLPERLEKPGTQLHLAEDTVRNTAFPDTVDLDDEEYEKHPVIVEMWARADEINGLFGDATAIRQAGSIMVTAKGGDDV